MGDKKIAWNQTCLYWRERAKIIETGSKLGQFQWPVSMRFQNKSADRASMKRIMKQPLQCMSFTFTFPRLGKAFNYCKMIGSHARWWNDLALSEDFIPFHRVVNNAREVSPWWKYFLLSPLRFMQKVQFCWYGALINVHDILVKLHWDWRNHVYTRTKTWSDMIGWKWKENKFDWIKKYFVKTIYWNYDFYICVYKN